MALVGHNGAGKTTLLNLLVGLIEPTEGSASVLGGERAGSPAALDAVGYVAQEAPLYQNLTVGDTLRVIASLNRRWDQARAEARLAELSIPLDRRVRRMSGGQQAQLALTLALARRPRLLVLDEPLAMLDPLARFDFMETVMAATSQDGISVVLSSHVRPSSNGSPTTWSCYPVAACRWQARSRAWPPPIRSSPAAGAAARLIEQVPAVHVAQGDDQTRILVNAEVRAGDLPAGWQAQPASLEEMVLGYLREPDASALTKAEEAEEVTV